MKALTLIQPYATLVAIHAKKFETRRWATDYRGRLAIHAAKQFSLGDKAWAMTNRFCSPALIQAGYTTYSSLPRGAVVAIGELVDCVPTPHSDCDWHYLDERIEAEYQASLHRWGIPPRDRELSFGDYSPGRYVWVLQNVRPLAAPIPAKGMQRLWEWDPPTEKPRLEAFQSRFQQPP